MGCELGISINDFLTKFIRDVEYLLIFSTIFTLIYCYILYMYVLSVCKLCTKACKMYFWFIIHRNHVFAIKKLCIHVINLIQK